MFGEHDKQITVAHQLPHDGPMVMLQMKSGRAAAWHSKMATPAKTHPS